MGGLDRRQFEALLGEAVAPGVHAVFLPKLGIDVYLRTEIGQADMVRIGAYASGGDADDVEARGILATVRYLVCDEDGKALIRSITEASRFIDRLPPEDFIELGRAVEEINAGAASVDVEEGKEPSSPSPGS